MSWAAAVVIVYFSLMSMGEGRSGLLLGVWLALGAGFYFLVMRSDAMPQFIVLQIFLALLLILADRFMD